MFWMSHKFITASVSKERTWLPSVQAQLWILGWCQLWLGPGACSSGGLGQQLLLSKSARINKEKGIKSEGMRHTHLLQPYDNYSHGGHPSGHLACAGPMVRMTGSQLHTRGHNHIKWSWFCIPERRRAAAVYSVQLFTASVAELFLFKFLPSPEPRGTVPARKVLRFCGNINSVLLHITCHPGGLWLISTYFSSLGPALIQMASGTPDQQPEIQPNPVRDFRTHRETHSWLWMMFVCFIYFEIFMIVNVIFDSKYCIWIYININIRQKYDVCSL